MFVLYYDILTKGPTKFETEPCNTAQSTSLICGVFMLHNTLHNPLFEALPPLLKLTVSHCDDDGSSATRNLVNLLLKEIDRPSFAHSYTMARYLELLCVKSIHTHIETTTAKKHRMVVCN